ncbi:MAG: hypothetical protein Q8Q08_06105 [Candidatus Omnitrophota bacterium]|nr:hypothetical protein [Candidatus Omnitrophota bacterium]MDZ4242030.1 hypothetical protein [Candidatus Omnitrophota bacterium]
MSRKTKEAQSIVEYVILLGTVTAIILLSFQSFMPKAYNQSEYFFNQTARGVMGDPPHNEVGGLRTWTKTNYP